MSAYMSSNVTLSIVAYALFEARLHIKHGYMGFDDVHEALVNENIRSLEYAYEDRANDMIGEREGIMAVDALPIVLPQELRTQALSVQHQCCEHPEWKHAPINLALEELIAGIEDQFAERGLSSDAIPLYPWSLDEGGYTPGHRLPESRSILPAARPSQSHPRCV